VLGRSAMARPWKNHGRWLHVAKSGARMYFVGWYLSLSRRE
jgi:hypothetical protein